VALSKQLSHDADDLYGCCTSGLVSTGLLDKGTVCIESQYKSLFYAFPILPLPEVRLFLYCIENGLSLWGNPRVKYSES
jgi:hypothetical protein